MSFAKAAALMVVNIVAAWAVTLYLAIVVRVPDGPFAYFVIVPALMLWMVGSVVYFVWRCDE